MDIRDIKKLVLEGETDSLEFKKKANFPEKIVKEIVAFANTRGGRLLIGVDDDSTVTGVKNYEEDIFSLNEAITNYCMPSIKYQLDVVKMNEKRAVLHYTIYESKDKPHFVKGENQRKNRKSYIRLADRSIQASPEMIEILKKRQHTKNIKVNFGEKERILMNYLGEHDKITLTTFSEIANIKSWVASKTLVWLVAANILDIEAREDEDIFTQKIL